MPLYDYKCNNCNSTKAVFTKITERHKQKCECGHNLKIIYITPPMTINANSGGRAV